MRSLIIMTVFFTGILLLCGCNTSLDHAQKNMENSSRLRVGMTKSEVLEIMGEPLRNEVFNKPDLWYYYVEQVWADGLVTEDECLPLVFEQGKLTGWGRIYLTRRRMRSQDNAKLMMIPGQVPYVKEQVDKAEPEDKTGLRSVIRESVKEAEKKVK